MKEQPILSIQNLELQSTAGTSLVAGVDFDIAAGECWGLLGMSGSGKSLTAAAMINLLPHGVVQTSGELYFSGEKVASEDEAAWCKLRGQQIGFVFQDPSTAFNPVLKIGLQVGESIEVHSPHLSSQQRQSQVLELLDEVGLENPMEIYSSYAHQLSGGMLQRAMIAAAIAGGPDLLIADEPTTALDLTVQVKILQLINKLVMRRKMALLWISHDLSVVAQVCQQVAIMNAGRIVERGQIGDVFAKPKTAFTRELMAAVPDFKWGQVS